MLRRFSSYTTYVEWNGKFIVKINLECSVLYSHDFAKSWRWNAVGQASLINLSSRSMWEANFRKSVNSRLEHSGHGGTTNFAVPLPVTSAIELMVHLQPHTYYISMQTTLFLIVWGSVTRNKRLALSNDMWAYAFAAWKQWNVQAVVEVYNYKDFSTWFALCFQRYFTFLNGDCLAICRTASIILYYFS
jgi:hypothetical protein